MACAGKGHGKQKADLEDYLRHSGLYLEETPSRLREKSDREKRIECNRYSLKELFEKIHPPAHS